MTNSTYFETTIFGTNEKIKIPFEKILKIEDRSLEPGKNIDHARVFIIGEGRLILINLEDAKKLEKMLKGE